MPRAQVEREATGGRKLEQQGVNRGSNGRTGEKQERCRKKEDKTLKMM